MFKNRKRKNLMHAFMFSKIGSLMPIDVLILTRGAESGSPGVVAVSRSRNDSWIDKWSCVWNVWRRFRSVP